MKFKLFIAVLSIALLFQEVNGFAASDSLKVRTIWNNGDHSAFTSLVRFKGRWYCSFREYDSHIFNAEGAAEGRVRIISSKNGRKWESVACFGLPLCDLRDPKLSVMPDGRLMVIIGGSYYRDKKLVDRVPQVSFSRDGRNFTPPMACGLYTDYAKEPNWIWRVTWNGDTGYAVCYTQNGNANDAFLSLVTTKDGIRYDLVRKFEFPGFPNETTVRFLEDGRMLMAVRRDGSNSNMLWGVSEPPYTDWKFEEEDFRIGGPDFISLPDGRILLAGRSYNEDGTRMSIWIGDVEGDLRKVIDLPSSGDCSYPGLVVKGRRLYVSYYTKPENEKNPAGTEIRFAVIPFKNL